MCVQSSQFCSTLYDPMDYNPPGSSVHGILQETMLEWVAMPSSRGSLQPRDMSPVSPALQVDLLPTEPSWKLFIANNNNTNKLNLKTEMFYVHARSVMSDSLRPRDCSPPGYSVHGILLARILEQIAISSHRGSS